MCSRSHRRSHTGCLQLMVAIQILRCFEKKRAQGFHFALGSANHGLSSGRNPCPQRSFSGGKTGHLVPPLCFLLTGLSWSSSSSLPGAGGHGAQCICSLNSCVKPYVSHPCPALERGTGAAWAKVPWTWPPEPQGRVSGAVLFHPSSWW